ncbi:MAG: hypothetical protein AAB649_06960 [Patescibacteria group bacterium]
MKKENTYFVKRWGEILHIFDPVFCVNYWYLKVKDFKKAERQLKRIGVTCELKRHNDGGFIVLKKFGQEICVIWTRGLTSDIIHECCHATNYVFEKKGIKLSVETDELFAYYTAFLFKAIKGGSK